MSRKFEDYALPPGYQEMPAAEKLDWLWEGLISPTAYVGAELPALTMPGFTMPAKELGVVTRTPELEKALTRTSDLMEPGRPKVIHARGTVAKVELETRDDSPFTGLLGPPPEGGASGLIRISLVASVAKTRSYTPGFGLKLLIDGKASADLLAMNHTIGQGRDYNLFSNTMTNDLSDEHEELRLPQTVMSALFERVSHKPRRMVTTHFTNQRRDGSRVSDPTTPIRLVFHPTSEAEDLFKGTNGVDFRLVLARFPSGITLYDIEAITDDGGVPVGRLRTSSAFVASAGGERLFFRHVQDPQHRKLG